MRWIVAKDLRILQRSKLLVALLVIYPIAIALLIGFALSKGPEKPKVAFLNLVPPGEETFSLGGEEVDASKYAEELFQSIEPVRVKTREEALRKVRDGDALAALIIPKDITEKLSSGLEQPTVEVAYNIEDPVKARFVESTIKARLADANQALSEKFAGIAVDYIDLLLKGGDFSLFGREFEVLGLEKAKALLEAARQTLRDEPAARAAMDRVIEFADLAIQNLDLSDDVLKTVAAPVKVKRTVVEGKRTPLDAFAVAISVTVSLMFVTVLLAAGLLALEREEHAFSRLVRGLVTRLQLLLGKVGLAAACASLVALLMLAGIGVFIGLDWGRAPLWIVAVAAGALAFAAMGVAIGGLAKEVRAASLLAFLLSLPIAFLALVPSGAVSGGLFRVIEVVSALFPFKPALQATNAALNDADPGMLRPLLHLAALTVAFTALARLALRRFA